LNRSFVISEILAPISLLLFRLGLGLTGGKAKISLLSDDPAETGGENLERKSKSLVARYLGFLEENDGLEVAVKAIEMFWEACYSEDLGGVDVFVKMAAGGLEVTREREEGMISSLPRDGSTILGGRVEVPGSTVSEEAELAASMAQLGTSDINAAENPDQAMVFRLALLLRDFSTTQPKLVSEFFAWILSEWSRTSSILRDSEEEADPDLELRQFRLVNTLMLLISVFSEPQPGDAEEPAALKVLLGSLEKIVDFTRTALLNPDEQGSGLVSTALTLLASTLSNDPSALLVLPKTKLEELNMLLQLASHSSDPDLEPVLKGISMAIRTALAFSGSATEFSQPSSAEDIDSADLLERSLADLSRPTSIAPLKARGLSTLSSLILSEDTRVLEMGLDKLIALGLEALQDPEEFVYINAIKYLAVVVDHDPENGIKGIVGEFAKDGERDSIEALAGRVKIGEVLLRVVMRRGEVLGRFGWLIFFASSPFCF
jgi:hypothetical protein